MNRDNDGCTRILPCDAHLAPPGQPHINQARDAYVVCSGAAPTDGNMLWLFKLVPLSDMHCTKKAARRLRVAVCDIA